MTQHASQLCCWWCWSSALLLHSRHTVPDWMIMQQTPRIVRHAPNRRACNSRAVTLPKNSLTLSCPTSFIPNISTSLWYRNCHIYGAGKCRSPTDSAGNSKWIYRNCICETWDVGGKHTIWHKNCKCLQSTFFLMISWIRTTRRKHIFPEEPYIYCTYSYEVPMAWS